MKNYTTFKFPYILIEDIKGKYQPMYKEYAKTLPFINFESPALCSPFSMARRSNGPKPDFLSKPGYCEICYSKFTDYKQHVESSEHREFAEDDYNYKAIDMFILDMMSDNIMLWVNNSPCEPLEAKYNALDQVFFQQNDNSDNVIRISKGSFDNEDETVEFDIILNKINKQGPIAK